MKTRAAVLWGVNEPWKIEEIELDPPSTGEVLVKTPFAGLCHSDEHLVTGDLVPPDDLLELLGMNSLFPMVGGHEGSGIVQEVGPGVLSLSPGDHVAFAFIPACGRCHYCSTGRQNLCDLGATTLAGGMISDGAYRHHVEGQDLNRMAQVGSFAEHVLVNEASLVKVEPDLSLAEVSLVSCGVATGVGAIRNRADITAGDTVVVVGIGGLGINAVQGAAMAGAANVVAVDVNPDKEAKARELGATHFFGSLEEANGAVMEMTWGRMAQAVILAPGVMTGDLLDPALSIIAKDGNVVIIALASMMARDVGLDLFSLAMYNKSIKGTVFGSHSPRCHRPAVSDDSFDRSRTEARPPPATAGPGRVSLS